MKKVAKKKVVKRFTAQSNYYQRQKERGLVQVSSWVPASEAERAKQYMRKLRKVAVK